MRRLRIIPATLLLALVVAGFGPALSGQAPASPPQVPAPAEPGVVQPPPVPTAPPEDPDPFDDDFGRSRRAAFRLGGDYTLASGDRIRNIVVIFGNATVDGIVDEHVVVIMGTARLGPNARIGDNFVVVGGGVQIAQGAVVERDMVVVGGLVDAPAGFTTRGEQVIIGPPFLGEWFEGLSAWLTRGLLFGRLIVPDLGWVWGAVALFFLLYLALNVIFERPVRAVAETLGDNPLTSFGVGLLVLLLFGPVAMLLAVSVIGIAVIPFLVCAMFAAWILGKVAVARWIGNGVMPEEAPDHRAQAVRSFVIGFAIIAVAYMIPLIGIVTWAVIGVLGLGAASMAFMAAYRRERPAPVPPPVLDTPPPPVPATYQPSPQVSQASAFVPSEPEPSAAAAPMSPPPTATAATVAIPAMHPSALIAMPRALFRDRFAAFVLDVIIVIVAIEIIDELIFFDGPAFPLLALIYFVGFWTWKQTTPGGVVCQLRLVRIDGNPLSFADALIRAIVGVFSVGIFFIGALWMLRDKDGQTWHDKIAGTYVVKVPRNWPL